MSEFSKMSNDELLQMKNQLAKDYSKAVRNTRKINEEIRNRFADSIKKEFSKTGKDDGRYVDTTLSNRFQLECVSKKKVSYDNSLLEEKLKNNEAFRNEIEPILKVEYKINGLSLKKLTDDVRKELEETSIVDFEYSFSVIDLDEVESETKNEGENK